MSGILDKKRFTVTAALPYANGPLHIGHIAGAYLPADIFVRFLRQKGKDVAFFCGSDEHGAAITIRAKKEGIAPQEIIDKYHTMIKSTFERFGIDFDMYHRTSAPNHHELSKEFFTDLYEKGEFIEKTVDQFYDEEYHQFLADRYVVGTCPVCSYDHAYGDQCEKCGSSLNPTDLIDPKSVLSGKKPVLKSTSHWYLPLDKYQPWLEDWLLKGKKDTWKVNVYGQCSSWLKAGLQPRAMTRDLDWGVDVPLKNAKGKKLYVWLDAPIGYISSAQQWAKEKGADWELYWKKQANEADNSCLIHFIGKDNIVFHCIIFPAILNAHGGYLLPENVPANEFLNLEGNKLSTSRNWAVWLHEYLDDFPGKEDVLRYVLAANMPETKDSEFTWKDFKDRNNNELVAILGNFVNRVLVLTQKYFEGKIPERGNLAAADQEVLQRLGQYPDEIGAAIASFKFRDALFRFIDLARMGNKYLADEEPWKKIKTDPERVGTILNIALQVAGASVVLGAPFLPGYSKKLGDILSIDDLSWEHANGDILTSGHQLKEPVLLFEKVEEEVIEAQINKLMKTKNTEMDEEEKGDSIKPVATFDDFVKLDLRVGKILEAQKVPKSKKLLQLSVSLGFENRTILSGIAEHFSPEDVVGQSVVVVANLAPRKIMGIPSEGMILMAEGGEGKLRFIAPQEGANPGDAIS